MTPPGDRPEGGATQSASTTPADEGELDREHFRRLLLTLTPEEFEYFIADLWEHLRDGETTVTQASGDMGVDVVLHGGQEREILQVKRYHQENMVGRPEVQQYYSLYDQENADRVTIVTSGAIANTAREWATEHGVTLFDGDDLYDLIRASDSTDILSTWFIDGDYTLADPGLLSRLKGAAESFTALPATVSRLCRPLWALLLAFSAVALIVIGIVSIVLTASGQQSLAPSGPAVDRFAQVVGISLLVSFFMFPISLYQHGERLRAVLIPALVVVSFGMINVLGDVSNIVYGTGLMVIYAAVLVITGYDLYDVHTAGWRTHAVEAIDGLWTVGGSGDDEGVEPMQYATVAARQDG